MNDWSVIYFSCWWQGAVLPLLSSSDVTSCVSRLQHVSSRFCPSAVSLYLSSLSLQHSGSFFISFSWFSCRSEGQRFALWSRWAFSSLDKRCLALWSDTAALSTAFEEDCSSETLREREKQHKLCKTLHSSKHLSKANEWIKTAQHSANAHRRANNTLSSKISKRLKPVQFISRKQINGYKQNKQTLS